MIFMGHAWLTSPKFITVKNKEEIAQKSSANDVVVLGSLDQNHTLASYCQDNGVAYALKVTNIKEALFANALSAKYILTNIELAPTLQKVATEYLFDTRILAMVDTEEAIESLAQEGVDGVIFTSHLSA